MTDMQPLPHHALAEESVIGAVMRQPDVMARLTTLGADEFYRPKMRAIWRAMIDLWSRNAPIDYASLATRLEAPDLIGASVTLLDLSEISLSTPTAANVEHYASLVSSAATQRKLVDVAQRLAESAWRSGADVEALMAQAEGWLSAARPRSSSRDLYTPQRWAEEFYADLDARANGKRTAITTGLDAIDQMTLGLESGRLYLLMGTPGTGKSELAMQIAMHAAQTHGTSVFASLEMSAIELAHRFARISYKIDRNRLAKGQLDEIEWQRATDAMNAMVRSRFWPSTPRGHYTTADLRNDCLEAQAQGGKLSLIVADYVQRFDDGDGVPAHREINVGMAAKNLKSLAREFGCPVLAPVQPNRDYVQRVSDKRPKLSDLRESGKLEQEADFVLGLFREEKHDEHTSNRGICEVHVLKNRPGIGDADGFRRLVWIGHKYGDLTGRLELPIEEFDAA